MHLASYGARISIFNVFDHKLKFLDFLHVAPEIQKHLTSISPYYAVSNLPPLSTCYVQSPTAQANVTASKEKLCRHAQ